MSHPLISYADSVAAIAVLPSLGLRPCATNIRALVVDLIDKLTIIPSEQSADLGYRSVVQQDEVYALQTIVSWVDWQDPGAVAELTNGWTLEQNKVAREV